MPKVKIVNKMKFYHHKGKKLTPLTDVEARSLDKGDVIKYIGPATGSRYDDYYSGYSTSKKDQKPYGYLARRPHALRQRPEIFVRKNPQDLFLRIDYYGSPLAAPIEHFAIVQRGDPYGWDLNKARRLVPENLHGFKRDIEQVIARTKKKIDKYLDALPIHKRMEIFNSLSKEDRMIYDFLSSGFERDMLEEKKEET